MQTTVGQLSDVGSILSGIAGVDPISAAMLAIGAVLTAGAIAFFGYLVLGAAVELIVPDRIGQTRRPGA